MRPTGSIRLDASVTFSRITRAGDGSEFARTIIPRLELEYRPTRALETGRVLSLEDLTRQNDGLFVELACLFRR